MIFTESKLNYLDYRAVKMLYLQGWIAEFTKRVLFAAILEFYYRRHINKTLLKHQYIQRYIRSAKMNTVRI